MKKLSMRLKIRSILLPLSLVSLLGIGLGEVSAHDQWANGDPVPDWVKSSCCGPKDAHVLSSEDYWIDTAGFHVRGIKMVVPFDQILPSQDGKVWAFYAPGVGE